MLSTRTPVMTNPLHSIRTTSPLHSLRRQPLTIRHHLQGPTTIIPIKNPVKPPYFPLLTLTSTTDLSTAQDDYNSFHWKRLHWKRLHSKRLHWKELHFTKKARSLHSALGILEGSLQEIPLQATAKNHTALRLRLLYTLLYAVECSPGGSVEVLGFGFLLFALVALVGLHCDLAGSVALADFQTCLWCSSWWSCCTF